MKKRIIIAAIALAAGASALSAQSRKAVRLNEVMVENNSSIVDDYGVRTGWIELFNANFAPVEISSMFLSNDSTQPRMYPVPLGDVNTRIHKRQHVVFFTDGEPNKGTFHTNFVLTPGQDNWIGLYDADGSLIDEVLIPASVEADQTFARATDGDGDWAVRTGEEDAYITPSSANVIKDRNSRVEMFAEKDENGFGMTIMAMCVVFSALLTLCLCFYAIGAIGKRISRSNKIKSTGDDHKDREVRAATTHDSGEEIAAIVMALHEHFNAHDTESTILTINKVKRAYSPWSSKIYGLRELPGHNRH
ncbi:MAG: OadG family protein [Muribaculaceae bacterium]|nr:OadG family protein [Muribaculaceae bacterium]MDE6541293.1 OadG family protein [Muribaculaceae bacterium]